MKIIGSQSGVRTPEFHKKKKQEQIVRYSLIVLLVVLLVILPIVLARLERFQIVHIELKGNNVTNDEELQAIVLEMIEGNYVWVFPKSNALLYPERSLEKRLLKDIPRLATADVSLENNRSLIVEVTEREPSALYCREVSSEIFNDCYFLDDRGFIFSRAPSFSHGVYEVFGNNPSLDNPLGELYMAEEEFAQVRTFTKELDMLPLKLAAFVSKEEEYELVLREGGIVKLNRKDDLRATYSNLESFVSDTSFKDEPNAWERLLYIDLRFGNKIFYKFQE